MSTLNERSISLLVVDDDAVDRAAVRRALRAPMLNVTITEATDASAALEALRTGCFDCVLLDYRLPPTDGVVVLERVRAAGVKTPIIVLTGQGDEELAVELMKAGAIDYLPKGGLAPERLRQSVQRAVRVGRAEIAAEAARHRVTRLQGFMAALAATRTVPEVAHTVMTQGLEAFHATRGLLAVQGEAPELHVIRADGYPDEAVADWSRIALDVRVPLTDAFLRAEPLYFESPEDLLTRYPDLEGYRAFVDQAVIVLPLVAAQRGLGAVVLAYETRQVFDDDHRRDLNAFARVCAQALERAQLFELANRERRRAEEASRAKDEFLAVVSHELRTPLNAILGWATMLRGGNLGPERAQRAAEIIERNARSQAQLIEDLLDVSRIITGKMRIERVRVDLAQVLEAALDVVRPAADAKGVELSLTVAPTPCEQLGDPERLQQVFWNLLSNAVKFTPRGGSVRACLNYSDRTCDVTVQDSGQGIAREFLPHVFERFRQEDVGTTRKSGGLGLGLAIVRHIVELHGGTVEVESAGFGEGSTFRVRLPAHQHASAAQEAQRPTLFVDQRGPTPLECPPELAGVAVLVVDDEEDARDLVVSVLSVCGATVSAAASASEALELMRHDRFDVLVSDLGMPQMDGYALIERVRAMTAAEGGTIPALALTAYVRSQDRARALLAGFDAHCAKPIEPSVLVEQLVAVLARQAAARRRS